MRTLSNNRSNALGPWYVYSNNGPSNSNANNWGGRTFPQGGKLSLWQKHLLRMNLNPSPLAKLIKSDSGKAAAPLRHASGVARFASQSPLKKRGLVGAKAPLEETRAERDAYFNRRAA